jgi:soluble lytic murein transglycosylase-like protein
MSPTIDSSSAFPTILRIFMEINFPKTIKRLFYLNIVYILPSTWVVIFVLGISNIHIVHAEPFIRLQKNGVIYYYFSDRENEISALHNRINQKMRIPRLQVHHKLSPRELEPWIKWASQHHKLPNSLIKAVIRVESNFNPAATSPKGAQGLMQLMPGTAEQLQVSNPYNIPENIWAGTRYLGMLLQKFNNNLPLALAAYNAGPHRVEQCKGIPPIEETQNFVRNVCKNFLKYSGRQGAPPEP